MHHKLTTAAEEGIGEASAGAHETIDRLSSNAKPAIDRAAAGAHKAVDRATVVANGATESLEAQVDYLLDAGVGATAQCRAYVRANPLVSLGIAFAAGFIFSRIRGSR